jgi:hypothetical protein
MILLMSKKQINFVWTLHFGLGIQHKLLVTSLTFLQFNTNIPIHALFHRTLHFHVWTELSRHRDVTSYCSTNPDFPCELCLVASPNIPSNSVARSSNGKLKLSLVTYLHDVVVTAVITSDPSRSVVVRCDPQGVEGSMCLLTSDLQRLTSEHGFGIFVFHSCRNVRS